MNIKRSGRREETVKKAERELPMGKQKNKQNKTGKCVEERVLNSSERSSKKRPEN